MGQSTLGEHEHWPPRSSWFGAKTAPSSPSCQMPRQSSAQCFIQLSRHVDGWGRALALHWDKGALDRELANMRKAWEQDISNCEQTNRRPVLNLLPCQNVTCYSSKQQQQQKHYYREQQSIFDQQFPLFSTIYLSKAIETAHGAFASDICVVFDNMTHTLRFWFCETSV